MTALEKIQRARTALVIDQPFFGVLSLRLRLVETDQIPTMATDGTHLLFNPAFVATLSTEELKGVIAHEVMHCACGHPWRLDAREPKRWNIACDYAVNLELLDAGFSLPKGGLVDRQWQGKWSEWIYDRIEVREIKVQMPGCGATDVMRPGEAQGTPTDEPGEGEVDGQGGAHGPLTEADWQQSVQQVAAAEKARGTLPASLRRLVGDLAESRVDWRSVLARFVQTSIKADYRWSSPNTRYLAGGLYLPEMRTEAMGPMAVAIDTSGSIDGVLLQQFASELNAIIGQMQPERVHVAYCDAAIQHTDVFERGDLLELRPKGGGGTAFEPVMDWLGDLDDPVQCLVYLTDLEGSFGEAPEVPVLWATTSGYATAPYGDVVRIS